MKYAMTDIETMATEPAGAAVISVATVLYNEIELIDYSVWYLDPMWTPGRRDKGAHDFWVEQFAKNAEVTRNFNGKMLPWDFCTSWSEFIALGAADEQWADPPRFDFQHLRELYHACGHAFPFSYRDERDLRTLRKVICRTPTGVGLDEQLREIKAETPHDPLSDALQQVKEHQRIMERLGLVGS